MVSFRFNQDFGEYKEGETYKILEVLVFRYLNMSLGEVVSDLEKPKEDKQTKVKPKKNK